MAALYIEASLIYYLLYYLLIALYSFLDHPVPCIWSPSCYQSSQCVMVQKEEEETNPDLPGAGNALAVIARTEVSRWCDVLHGRARHQLSTAHPCISQRIITGVTLMFFIPCVRILFYLGWFQKKSKGWRQRRRDIITHFYVF